MKKAIMIFILSLGFMLLCFASTTNASTYHSNMIQKTFVSSVGSREAEKKSDHWVDSISDISKYNVKSSYEYSPKTYGDLNEYYIIHITLIKRHYTPFEIRLLHLIRLK